MHDTAARLAMAGKALKDHLLLVSPDGLDRLMAPDIYEAREKALRSLADFEAGKIDLSQIMEEFAEVLALIDRHRERPKVN